MKPTVSQAQNEELLRWLEREPALRERLLAMKAAVEAETAAGSTLDEVEGKLVDEVRGLGRELLTRWAESKQLETAARQAARGAHRHSKKNSGC